MIHLCPVVCASLIFCAAAIKSRFDLIKSSPITSASGNQIPGRPTFHSIGDSHASFFMDRVVDELLKEMNVVIKYNRSLLMEEVVAAGLGILDFKKLTTTNPCDIVAYSCGEIDVRSTVDRFPKSHLLRELRALVANFETALKNSIQDTPGVQMWVYGLIPTYDVEMNKIPISPNSPREGSDLTRTLYTLIMNDLLQSMAMRNSWTYFDRYYDYATPRGTLEFAASDFWHHIKHYKLITLRKWRLLAKRDVQRCLNQ